MEMVLIGHAYTRRLGLEPGQEFRIELQRDSGAIWLHPMEQDIDDQERSEHDLMQNSNDS